MIESTSKREEIIEQWMLTIAHDGGARRFDDLHIDEIDTRWKPREQWIEGGLEAHRIALAVRDRNQLLFTVGLGFSLESCDRPLGVDFETTEELRQDQLVTSFALPLSPRRGARQAGQQQCSTVSQSYRSRCGRTSALLLLGVQTGWF